MLGIAVSLSSWESENSPCRTTGNRVPRRNFLKILDCPVVVGPGRLHRLQRSCPQILSELGVLAYLLKLPVAGRRNRDGIFSRGLDHGGRDLLDLLSR